MSKIILASASPRRKQLLQWADVCFEVKSVPTDESFPEDLSPEEQTVYIAQNKGLAVQEQYKYQNDTAIIAADTVVVLEGRVIGKPGDKMKAIETLKALSGQKHMVITGVSILFNGQRKEFCEITEVLFHSLTHEQISFYVEKYKPYDKAGAYGIQEWIGVIGVKAIHGDFYNVMGLPVSRVIAALKELHVNF